MPQPIWQSIPTKIVKIVISVSFHKSIIVLWWSSLNVFDSVFVFVFVFVILFFLVMSCLLITLIKCLKGHKSLGSLCSVLKTLWLLVVPDQRTNQGTRSPIELFWTAKKTLIQICLFRFGLHCSLHSFKSLSGLNLELPFVISAIIHELCFREREQIRWKV